MNGLGGACQHLLCVNLLQFKTLNLLPLLKMEEKPNLDMVILAVSTLYKNPDKKEKDKASEWLLHLQNSVSFKKMYLH